MTWGVKSILGYDPVHAASEIVIALLILNKNPPNKPLLAVDSIVLTEPCTVGSNQYKFKSNVIDPVNNISFDII